MGRSQQEEAPFEIDGVEYIPASASRSEVHEFRVGDRIGNNKYLITQSEPDPTDPECWLLTWVKESGEESPYNGNKTSKDYRWVQATYVIQETP